MAINNTGAMFKSFEFDGTDSRNYGVYITGAAVYDAPEREVEMISIPNRNGAFALDKGRFENIEITYPAGIFADTEADFAEAISDLRNFLCSKRGYCRLTDEYNPNEYRMAIYKSGLEVEPSLLKAGEFEITFECMPQRFLLSGEGKITLTSGQTVTNPTLFDASPLIESYGYGELIVDNKSIEIDQGLIGNVTIYESNDIRIGRYFSIPSGQCNAGDSMTIDGLKTASGSYIEITSGNVPSLSNITVSGSGASHFTITNISGKYLYYTYEFPHLSFIWGTTQEISETVLVTFTSSTGDSVRFQKTFKVAYRADSATANYLEVDALAGIDINISYEQISFTNLKVNVDSTISRLGNPTYIDADIGEAYKIENGEIISLNQFIDLGSDLPVLKSGTNTITFDNTFTQVDLIPRWWKL